MELKGGTEATFTTGAFSVDRKGPLHFEHCPQAV